MECKDTVQAPVNDIWLLPGVETAIAPLHYGFVNQVPTLSPLSSESEGLATLKKNNRERGGLGCLRPSPRVVVAIQHLDQIQPLDP